MRKRLFSGWMILAAVGCLSLPARANPLTDFADQVTGQAWSHIETALGQSGGHPASGSQGDANAAGGSSQQSNNAGYGSNQPGLNPNSTTPRSTRPATSLMVSQAGMAALENMRMGASLDVGAGHIEQQSPSTLTPVVAGLNDSQVRETIVKDHLISYEASGRCMCPNQLDKNGQVCGRKASYSKSNGNVVCYTSQIDQRMVWEWRTAHPAGR